MAMAFDSKFIDTSCVLKHNVDELLVGLTKQILLRQVQDIAGSREKVLNFTILNLIFILYLFYTLVYLNDRFC